MKKKRYKNTYLTITKAVSLLRKNITANWRCFFVQCFQTLRPCSLASKKHLSKNLVSNVDRVSNCDLGSANNNVDLNLWDSLT